MACCPGIPGWQKVCSAAGTASAGLRADTIRIPPEKTWYQSNPFIFSTLGDNEEEEIITIRAAAGAILRWF
jgi:hypothetical protein